MADFGPNLTGFERTRRLDPARIRPNLTLENMEMHPPNVRRVVPKRGLNEVASHSSGSAARASASAVTCSELNCCNRRTSCSTPFHRILWCDPSFRPPTYGQTPPNGWQIRATRGAHREFHRVSWSFLPREPTWISGHRFRRESVQPASRAARSPPEGGERTALTGAGVNLGRNTGIA